MLKVLEHILVTWPATHPDHRAYTDAIKELQSESLAELQRLAAKMPDHLLVREPPAPIICASTLANCVFRKSMIKSRPKSTR